MCDQQPQIDLDCQGGLDQTQDGKSLQMYGARIGMLNAYTSGV